MVTIPAGGGGEGGARGGKGKAGRQGSKPSDSVAFLKKQRLEIGKLQD